MLESRPWDTGQLVFIACAFTEHSPYSSHLKRHRQTDGTPSSLGMVPHPAGPEFLCGRVCLMPNTQTHRTVLLFINTPMSAHTHTHTHTHSRGYCTWSISTWCTKTAPSFSLWDTHMPISDAPHQGPEGTTATRYIPGSGRAAWPLYSGHRPSNAVCFPVSSLIRKRALEMGPGQRGLSAEVPAPHFIHSPSSVVLSLCRPVP